ncbi:MAG: ABC transporter ATP-binding protein [Prevotella sp.]|nr:ABC transporter ATP-binding protein [Prevotella sp.]
MQHLPSLTLSSLTIGYHGKPVAEHLNAEIYAGELTCLLGTNGKGKSTLLRTLSGLQPPLSGEVLLSLNGRPSTPVSSYSKHDLAQLISVVLTEQPDVKQITVTEMVGMGRMPYTGFFGTLSANDRRIMAASLTETGISDMSKRHFDTLSDGERQKVMIAKALAQQTPIILLDEPTAFLDYPSKVEMMKLLHRLANEKGKTILLSTHDLELALQHADQLLTMEQGLHYVQREELEHYLQESR